MSDAPEQYDALMRYRLFGFTIESPLALPELLPATPGDPVDIFIGAGVGPESSYRFDMDGVAGYSISGGTHIFIDAREGADPDMVRLFLLGSAMGALLHQRSILPLHANAIEIGGKAYCFAGESGAGKSTLAKAFCDAGFKLLADDVAAVRMDDVAGPVVEPGVMRLRLGSPSSTSADGKSVIAIAPESRSHLGLPLGGVFVLERGSALALKSAEGAAAIEQLYAHTYRGFHVAELGSAATHWNAVHRILGAVGVRRFIRPWNRDLLASQVEWLVRQLH